MIIYVYVEKKKNKVEANIATMPPSPLLKPVEIKDEIAKNCKMS